MDKTSQILGNDIDSKTIKKAKKSKRKFIKKFGDDSNKIYHLGIVPNETLGETLNIKNFILSDKPEKLADNALVIGNIRMGFGHYRISIAIASCANSMGYTPYWFDLNSFKIPTGSQMINHQNDLYSMGSRLSQKYKLFNKFYWEPLNSEGFKKITYNAIDQKNSEILVPLYHDLEKNVPFVATHVWPSQGAIHSGLTNVVNVIPDNWPMGLHLSEGAIHTVQTPFAFLGYKMLNKMGNKALKPMPDGSLFNVGHYIDHELVCNLESDCLRRIERLENKETLRVLLTIGGAGAQYNLFKEMISFLIPYVNSKKVCLFINFGDHLGVYNKLSSEISELLNANKYFNCWNDYLKMVDTLNDTTITGINLIYNSDIFRAVYSTNLLLRYTDILATKPSELAFYPVPKLMIERVGGHEAYGAIHASEVGDGTFECTNAKDVKEMFRFLITEKEFLINMNKNIMKNNKMGLYNGGYEVIKLATRK